MPVRDTAEPVQLQLSVSPSSTREISEGDDGRGISAGLDHIAHLELHALDGAVVPATERDAPLKTLEHRRGRPQAAGERNGKTVPGDRARLLDR